MATIREIAAEAAIELSLVRDIDSLFSAYDEGDTSGLRMRRALTRTLERLNTVQDWQFQRREKTFTWPAPGGQAVAAATWKAADFKRFVPNTVWSPTLGRKLFGPVSPSDWQSNRLHGALYTGAWRIVQNNFMVTPAMAHGNTIVYEYISEFVAISAGGEGRTKIAADTDTTPWRDETVILGIIANYRRTERLDYAEDEMRFERAISEDYRVDGGRRIIDMTIGDDSMGPRAIPTISIISEQGLAGYSVGE